MPFWIWLPDTTQQIVISTQVRVSVLAQKTLLDRDYTCGQNMNNMDVVQCARATTAVRSNNISPHHRSFLCFLFVTATEVPFGGICVPPREAEFSLSSTLNFYLRLLVLRLRVRRDLLTDSPWPQLFCAFERPWWAVTLAKAFIHS